MFDIETLERILAKTDGKCRFCGKKLSPSNYGRRGRHGAWAVDHSVPVASGGTDHLNNLFASCYYCNENKADTHGASYKTRLRRNGHHVAKRDWWSGEYR